jgi:predicted negative regulator of RcsB-dependent stress response
VRGDAWFAKGDKSAALNEYRSARAKNEGGAAALLDLKIADLAAAPAPAAPAASAPAAAVAR